MFISGKKTQESGLPRLRIWKKEVVIDRPRKGSRGSRPAS